MKRLILIRPGETSWNRFGRWQGWVNVPLNEHGRQQARRLARHIRSIGVNMLYSSDLRRAAETAAILAESLGFAPIYDARLRERHIGNWQGLTMDEIVDWYPEEYQAFLKNVDGFQVPGGESRAEVRARALAALDDIQGRGGSTVAVVSHTTAIHILLAKLLDDESMFSLPLSNMSVTTIAQNADGQWKMIAANDVLHLEGLEAQHVPELEDER